MMPVRPRPFGWVLIVVAFVLTAIADVHSQEQNPAAAVASDSRSTLSQFVSVIRARAKTFEDSSGMQQGFRSFVSAHNLTPDSVSYHDYVVVHLLFEATRDAGFWNMHWSITDQPPNSDKIWRQWQGIVQPSALKPTATAECDELSALYAFLVERIGVKPVGLFWPYANHTVAVWTLRPAAGIVVRVVVPTSQIFLDQTDTFDTRKFDPWHQKTIYEYTRRDVPDSFEFPTPLFDFFLRQLDKYGGASEATLQQLRYLREGVFLKAWTPEDAARGALTKRNNLASGPAEDLAAFQSFAQDMRPAPVRSVPK
jgi:hypothetical protein